MHTTHACTQEARPFMQRCDVQPGHDGIGEARTGDAACDAARCVAIWRHDRQQCPIRQQQDVNDSALCPLHRHATGRCVAAAPWRVEIGRAAVRVEEVHGAARPAAGEAGCLDTPLPAGGV